MYGAARFNLLPRAKHIWLTKVHCERFTLLDTFSFRRHVSPNTGAGLSFSLSPETYASRVGSRGLQQKLPYDKHVALQLFSAKRSSYSCCWRHLKWTRESFKGLLTRLELGPQQKYIYLSCLVSGKQRGPNKAKHKKGTNSGEADRPASMHPDS